MTEYDKYLCTKCGEPGCLFMVPFCENERVDLPDVCPWRKVMGDGKTKYSRAKWEHSQ
jgi:hypothetical protein